MRNEALFLNGVYESVLAEILKIQTALPEQILYLQPYSSERIVRLHENPPSPEDPVQLFISTSDDLNTIHFTGEVVGCDHKARLSGEQRRALNRIIWTLQPEEGGLYEEVRGSQCTNLLHVRRVKKLDNPFSIADLRNIKDGKPLSPNRTTSGGWVYVKRRAPENLL